MPRGTITERLIEVSKRHEFTHRENARLQSAFVLLNNEGKTAKKDRYYRNILIQVEEEVGASAVVYLAMLGPTVVHTISYEAMINIINGLRSGLSEIQGESFAYQQYKLSRSQGHRNGTNRTNQMLDNRLPPDDPAIVKRLIGVSQRKDFTVDERSRLHRAFTLLKGVGKTPKEKNYRNVLLQIEKGAGASAVVYFAIMGPSVVYRRKAATMAEIIGKICTRKDHIKGKCFAHEQYKLCKLDILVY
jgi:hypothetical protein